MTELTIGPDWYFNPARWPTIDGYASYDAVWDGWRTMMQARALERLNIVRAHATLQAGAQAQVLIESDVKEATGGG
jgi:hypothetical protein